MSTLLPIALPHLMPTGACENTMFPKLISGTSLSHSMEVIMMVRFAFILAGLVVFAVYAIDSNDAMQKCQQKHSYSTCANSIMR